MPPNGAVFALDGILIGAGDTRFLMWSMLAAAAVYVPLALLALHQGWGIVGVWAGLAALFAVRLLTLRRALRRAAMGAHRRARRSTFAPAHAPDRRSSCSASSCSRRPRRRSPSSSPFGPLPQPRRARRRRPTPTPPTCSGRTSGARRSTRSPAAARLLRRSIGWWISRDARSTLHEDRAQRRGRAPPPRPARAPPPPAREGAPRARRRAPRSRRARRTASARSRSGPCGGSMPRARMPASIDVVHRLDDLHPRPPLRVALDEVPRARPADR